MKAKAVSSTSPVSAQGGFGRLVAGPLGSLRRIIRLTWVEILKLISHRLFPVTLIVTLVVTAGIGIAAKLVTEQMGSKMRFSNYGLWVTSSDLGLRVGMILLVALGALAMSTEATARTLNTVLARPIRRFEFGLAKVLSLIFATVAVIAAAALAGFVVGGTVRSIGPPAASAGGGPLLFPGERRPGQPPRAPQPPSIRTAFPTYGDIVDPDYPRKVFRNQAGVMGDIFFGYLLLIVPALAGVSLGFLLGTFIDSSGVSVGLSVGLFVTLEITKSIPVLEEYLGRFAYNYPLTTISTRMLEAGSGDQPVWDNAIVGVGYSAIYVGVWFLISLVAFCRRDITL